MAEVTSRIGQRLAMRDKAAFHVALLCCFHGLVDGDGELRCDLDRRWIAAKFRGTALDQRDALFHLVQGTPAAKPALAVFRDTLKRFKIVAADIERDRKSTRLNSSHVKISYAVFCLKKKRIIL